MKDKLLQLLILFSTWLIAMCYGVAGYLSGQLNVMFTLLIGACGNVAFYVSLVLLYRDKYKRDVRDAIDGDLDLVKVSIPITTEESAVLELLVWNLTDNIMTDLTISLELYDAEGNSQRSAYAYIDRVEAHEQATTQTSIPLTFKDAEVRCVRLSNYRYIPVSEEKGITKCGGPRDSLFRNSEMIRLCLVSADKEREGLHDEK
ncbi:MAG: hypothetical protein KH138_07600 [Firmicutes bacterium]|nr:hypothetical protein [Bacillota bacterium]